MTSYIVTIFSLIWTLSIPAWSLSDASFKGNLTVIDNHYYFIPYGSKQKLAVVVLDPLIKARLNCLKEGDFLTGKGHRFTPEQLVISSIEYVGLTDLLGTWRDEDEVFRFTDMRNFYYWDFQHGDTQFKGPFSYHYALSPFGDNPEQCMWKIFIIDSAGVVLGSLDWSAEDQIHMQFYDTDTGEVTSIKHLIRTTFLH
jgi:hypothetical protein